MTTTHKAWFIRAHTASAWEGYYAVAKNLETGYEVPVGPFSFPTVEEVRSYITQNWHGGTDFPGSLDGETGEPHDIIVSRYLADLC